ncbi:TIGR03086 family metal-binding protein [Actinosynnema sp. NPDC050436]|uniref:TIGR03086 family metal-binding protein n=1 Tax=Actinosynnema sp. NPDC050436 TaxID=3155659 RepID=UPI0033F01281
MDLIEAHGRAMTEFDARVRRVRPDQWGLRTPCAEWTVHDLVTHLVQEQLWAPELLAGCTVEQVGDRFDGDLLGDDPVRAWVLAAAAAREAWISPKALIRPVHLSSGRATSEEYGWQMALDLGVHAWDLAQAIGADSRLDPDLARTLLEYAREHHAEFAGSGIFADPVPVPDDASDQDHLLALLGRTP